MKVSIVDFLTVAFVICCFSGVAVIYYYYNEWFFGIILILIGVLNFIQAYRIGEARAREKSEITPK